MDKKSFIGTSSIRDVFMLSEGPFSCQTDVPVFEIHGISVPLNKIASIAWENPGVKPARMR